MSLSPSLSHLFAQHSKDLKPSSPASPCASIAALQGSQAAPALQNPSCEGWIQPALQSAGAEMGAWLWELGSWSPRLACYSDLSAGCRLHPTEIPLAGSKLPGLYSHRSHTVSALSLLRSLPRPDLSHRHTECSFRRAGFLALGGFSGFKLYINVSRYFGNADFPVAAQLNASVPNQHLLNKTSPFSSLFPCVIVFLQYLMNDFVP